MNVLNYERDSHKHANYIQAHKHANTHIYEGAYKRDSHKHANTSIYENPARICLYYSLFWCLISTLIYCSMLACISVLMSPSHKHAHICLYWRAYENASHKHAHICLY